VCVNQSDFPKITPVAHVGHTIFRKEKDFILGRNDNQADEEYRDRNVRPASEDPYGDPADQDIYSNAIPASQDPYGDPADYYGNAIPASQDPYGDPADVYSNAIPASQDPYGDPADQEFGDVRPASEDPYGDPADEEYRR
jgi:hypothetical protein